MITKTLAFMVTYGCNFKCAHCSVSSEPKLLAKQALFEKLMLKAIDEAYYIPSIKVIILFTGGEPTLKPRLLKKGIKYAAEKGFIVRLVTNAWWASSEEGALEFLKELQELGLNELNVSFDDFHKHFIKESNMIYAVKAALKLEMKVAIATTIHKYSEMRKEHIRKMLSNNGIDLTNIYILEDHFQPLGRAKNLSDSLIDEEYVSKRYRADLGCKRILEDIVVHPDGKVTVCCGHAIFEPEDVDYYIIGYLDKEDLETIIKRAQRNVLYWWLYLKEPQAILKYLGYGLKDKKFLFPCYSCFYLMSKCKNELYDVLTKRKETIFYEEILQVKPESKDIKELLRSLSS